MGGLVQVYHDQKGNAFWAGNNLYAGASAGQATGATAVTLVNLLAGAKAGDTPALIGAQALTVIVYNDATAQTITGLSLASTGTTASGGVGSIKYPITVDVSGNPVNIATGSSQTFFIPMTNGVLENMVLTPTFGAAPAAGTIETMTTVHTSPTAAMQMLGSSETLPVSGQGGKINGPTMIASIPYSSFTANTTISINAPNTLSRNALSRTFFWNNSMNQTVTSLGLSPYDSVASKFTVATEEWVDTGGVGSFFTNTYNSNGNNLNDGFLVANVDSCKLSAAMGSTAPTSGSLDVWVIEVL